jgi:hypothetical protein
MKKESPESPNDGGYSVQVLDSEGKPCYKCRPAKARQLLKQGDATIEKPAGRGRPFVLRLKK